MLPQIFNFVLTAGRKSVFWKAFEDTKKKNLFLKVNAKEEKKVLNKMLCMLSSFDSDGWNLYIQYFAAIRNKSLGLY